MCVITQQLGSWWNPISWFEAGVDAAKACTPTITDPCHMPALPWYCPDYPASNYKAYGAFCQLKQEGIVDIMYCRPTGQSTGNNCGWSRETEIAIGGCGMRSSTSAEMAECIKNVLNPPVVDVHVEGTIETATGQTSTTTHRGSAVLNPSFVHEDALAKSAPSFWTMPAVKPGQASFALLRALVTPADAARADADASWSATNWFVVAAVAATAGAVAYVATKRRK